MPPPVADAAKKHGISDATIYAWRKRYGQLESTDVKRLRHLRAREREPQEECLTVMDEFTREALAIDVAGSIRRCNS